MSSNQVNNTFEPGKSFKSLDNHNESKNDMQIVTVQPPLDDAGSSS